MKRDIDPYLLGADLKTSSREKRSNSSFWDPLQTADPSNSKDVLQPEDPINLSYNREPKLKDWSLTGNRQDNRNNMRAQNQPESDKRTSRIPDGQPDQSLTQCIFYCSLLYVIFYVL
jgi:hypothetical protein